MAVASDRELFGDDWRIYEYVTRHFIATVSPNCKYVKTNARFDILGETFKCSGAQFSNRFEFCDVTLQFIF